MKVNLLNITILAILFALLFSFVSPMTVSANGGFWDGFNVNIETGKLEGSEGTQGWGALMESIKEVIVGVAGVSTVIAVGFFIVNFMKLGGTSAKNRSEAISGLLYSGLATAGLGSVTLITAMFYGMIG